MDCTPGRSKRGGWQATAIALTQEKPPGNCLAGCAGARYNARRTETHFRDRSIAFELREGGDERALFRGASASSFLDRLLLRVLPRAFAVGRRRRFRIGPGQGGAKLAAAPRSADRRLGARN